ncbi:hypothetical protein FDECE_1610 [Fusarium decemcellulare]|nr:hypothetical protein FDECE_1610 [Fusarium decemcellulare]
MPQAPRIPKAAWEAHKDLICSLYLVEDKTLDEVIRFMEQKHGFRASKPQYIRKLTVNWKLRKNSTKEEWEQANTLVSKRQAEGKPTELMMNGVMILSKKKKKEMNRYKTSQTEQLSVLTDISESIVVWTPSPVDKPLILRATLPWFQFQNILGHLGLEGSVEVNLDKIAGSFHQFDASKMPLFDVGSEHLGLQKALPQILTSLDEQLPVNHGCKNRLEVPESSRSATWVRFFYTLAFLSTNGLVDGNPIYQFLRMAMSSNGLLEGLKQVLQVKGSTAKMLGVQFLFCTLKIESKQSLEITTFLLEQGVNPNSVGPSPPIARGSDLWTALQTAVWHNNGPAVQRLLEYKADPDVSVRSSLLPPALFLAIMFRDTSSIAQAFIDAGANVNIWDGRLKFSTPLSWAVENGDVARVRQLLQVGADPNYIDARSLSALHHAIKLGHATIVSSLTEAGANPNMFQDVETSRALMKAIKRCFLELGWRYRDGPLQTPLQAAVSRGNIGIVQHLVKEGAILDGLIDLSSCDGICGLQNPTTMARSPLGIAICDGEYDIAEFLLQAGADINFQHPELPSPLQSACGLEISEEKSRTVELLLKWGAEIDAPPSAERGRTALQAAAEVGDYDLVKDLLLRGARLDVPAAQKGGVTVLEAAIKSGRIDLVNFLLCSLQAPYLDVQSCAGHGMLEAAAASGNVQLLNMVLETYFSLNVQDLNKYSTRAFKAAVSKGSVSVVQRLFEVGANINATGNACSILCKAISERNEEIVNLLISKFIDLGLSLDDTLPGDETPLWTAARDDNAGTVKRLIRAGATIDRQFSCNCRDCSDLKVKKYATALGYATDLEHRCTDSLIQVLLDAGADVNSYGQGLRGPPLVSIAWTGEESTAKILLSYGADPNGRQWQNGNTVLDWVFINRRFKRLFPIVKLLIEHGLDVNAPCHWGYPLQQAIQLHADEDRPRRFWADESIRISQLLLDAGADVNAPATERAPMMALQSAIDQKVGVLIDLFLNAGANIHAPAFPNRGKTALQAAASTGNLQLVKKLIAQGANVNAEPAEKFGATALQFAAMSGNVNVAIYLLENGALINAPTAQHEGRTVLQGAAEHGRLDMIYMLLENDDDPDTVEERCQDAAKFAEAELHPEIAEMLKGYKRPW